MKTNFFFKKRVLPLLIILGGLSCQVAYAAYDNITTDEVKQFYQQIIAKEKAEHANKQRLLISQKRKRQHVRAKRQVFSVRQQRQYHTPKPTYTARRADHANRSVPAWRKKASHTMTPRENNALFSAAKSRNLARLKQLVAKGADVHHTNFSGESSLHIAASLGDMRMVQYLLSQGVNVNAKTGKNWLPLHHAMRFNHPVVANYLIANRASLWLKNTDGFSALDFAERSKNTRIKAIARRYGR